MQAKPRIYARKGCPIGVVPSVAARGWTTPFRAGATRLALANRRQDHLSLRPALGPDHKGIDIAAPPGTLVCAAERGQVTFAGWRSGYGLYVAVTHPGGWRTAYGHDSCLLVRTGQGVSAGTALARIGATGNATGIHLHFEIIGPDGYIDPLRMLR